jgi:phosphatidate cytidylyltransferase
VNKRHFYGWLLFLIACGSIAAGGIMLAISLGVASYIAGNEYLAMAQAKGFRPSPRIVRGMIIAFYAMAALPHTFHLPWNFGLEHFPLLLLVGINLSFIRLLFRDEAPPATIADIATTILGFIYIGFLTSHFVLLRNLTPPGTALGSNPLFQPGVCYVTTGLFCVFATDIFAYICGKRFGKTPLYPLISPKKTVEGAIGGFVASILWATLMVWFFDAYWPGLPFRGKLWQAPLMGAAISVASQLGDLCESMLKRDANMKDAGNIIPGHGGILDRGDGMIFGAPIAYYWICLVVLGIL